MALGMTVRQLGESMDARELAEWRTIWGRYETFGDERADLRNGILCSLTDAVNRAKGKPRPPKAYMPFEGSEKKTIDPDVIKARFRMFNARVAGRVAT